MEIHKPVVVGTLGPSGCQVTVEPGEGDIEPTLESVVINQYRNQVKRVVVETLEDPSVKDVRIAIVDKGVLDCTIGARVESAVSRATRQYDNLPWGGIIR